MDSAGSFNGIDPIFNMYSIYSQESNQDGIVFSLKNVDLGELGGQ